MRWKNLLLILALLVFCAQPAYACTQIPWYREQLLVPALDLPAGVRMTHEALADYDRLLLHNPSNTPIYLLVPQANLQGEAPPLNHSLFPDGYVPVQYVVDGQVWSWGYDIGLQQATWLLEADTDAVEIAAGYNNLVGTNWAIPLYAHNHVGAERPPFELNSTQTVTLWLANNQQLIALPIAVHYQLNPEYRDGSSQMCGNARNLSSINAFYFLIMLTLQLLIWCMSVVVAMR